MQFKNITKVEYFTKGKRGLLYIGRYKRKKVVVKVKNPRSEAKGRIQNEYKWLVNLNKKGIGPKVLGKGKGYFFYRYVPGEFVEKYFEKSSKKEIIRVLKAVLLQCYEMDKLMVDKEEMHHPYKHVVCKKGCKPVLLDFERCHLSKKPKNVTQFCQYIISSRITEILKEKGIKVSRKEMIELCRGYKRDMSDKRFGRILDRFIIHFSIHI